MHSTQEETTYEILSGLLKLKFKAQIKDCGVEFISLYRIINLTSNTETYTLVLNNATINFLDKTDFIKKFIVLLEKNVADFDARFDELQNSSNELYVDENALFLEHEEIGFYGSKQRKLLKKMRCFQEKN